MRTIRTMLILAAMAAVQFIKAQGFGEIRGLIKDDDYEPVIGAVVKITQGGYLIGGTTTDVNGKYVYKPLNAGEYELVVTSPMHSTHRITAISVKPNEASYVDVKMKVNSLGTVEIVAPYEEPMVDATMIDILSISADEWDKSPNKTEGVLNTISYANSGAVADGEGQWHLHGARADATEYLIDGVKVRSMDGLPNSSIENISLISGGIPAMYGDLTSGVIVVTTKDYSSFMRARRIRDTEYKEKQEYKRQKKIEKLEEENRKKEIEQEKLNDKKGK
jgi:hypothetical protein